MVDVTLIHGDCLEAMAAMEGREFIGIEKESEYIEIARRRIEAASAQERLPV